MAGESHNGRYVTKEFFESKIESLQKDNVHLEKQFQTVVNSFKDLYSQNEKNHDENLKLAKENSDSRMDKMNELREEFTEYKSILTSNYVTRLENEATKDRIIALEKIGSGAKIQNAFWTLIGILLGGALLKFLGI